MRRATLLVCSFLFAIESLAAVEPKALVVCDMEERPYSLDPFNNLDGKLSFVLRQVLGPWIDRDEHHALAPGIFAAWRNTAPTKWEFTIRKDLRFSDGSPLSVGDVVFSIETAISKGSALANEFGSIATVEGIGADKIEVTTKSPDPMLPARFANRPFLVDKALYESLGHAYFAKPIGVWAYKIVSIDDASLVLSRNARFPDKTSGMESIVYRFIKGGQARIEALKKGEIDILTELSPTMSLDVARDPDLSVVKVTVAQYVALFFDVLPDPDGLFSDKSMREFMYRAIDDSELIALAVNGNGLPLATITMPQEFGYNPSLKPRPADPVAAQNLLQKRRSLESSPLTIRIAVVDYLENIGKTIKGQLAKYGVDAELMVLPRDEVISKVMLKKEIKADAFIVDPMDPFLDASFQLNLETNSAYATAWFSTQEIKTLLGKANLEMDETARADLLSRVQTALYDDFGPLPLYQKIALYGVSKKVKNFHPLADIYLRLENVSKE